MRRNDIPDDRQVRFKPSTPSIKRAKVVFKEFEDNIDLFEQEVEKAFNTGDDICTICGYQSYDNTGRCEDHENYDMNNWHNDDVIIPEQVHISLERNIDEL